MKIAVWIANRINFYCQERDITINKLSSLSGITQSTLNSIMHGESKNPKLSTIVKICDGIGITTAEFFRGIEKDVDID